MRNAQRESRAACASRAAVQLVRAANRLDELSIAHSEDGQIFGSEGSCCLVEPLHRTSHQDC